MSRSLPFSCLSSVPSLCSPSSTFINNRQLTRQPLDIYFDLWPNHRERFYYFTGSKPVFQTRCNFFFAWLLRRRWCKSNITSRSCSLGILMHTKWQRVGFCIPLPHPAIFELTLPAPFSPASRTSPAPYSPGLPPPPPLPLLHYLRVSKNTAQEITRRSLCNSILPNL